MPFVRRFALPKILALVMGFLLLASVPAAQAKTQQEQQLQATFNVLAFYNGNWDAAHIDFVKEANQRFPQFPPLVADAGRLQTPWLGLFGDLDTGIPPEDVEAVRAALDAADPVPHEIVRYADADHGFHCNDRPAVYDPTAAVDAWDRTLAWFDRFLGAPQPA